MNDSADTVNEVAEAPVEAGIENVDSAPTKASAMITAAEKASIIARLEFEHAIRAALAQREEPSGVTWKWINSKIGLLVFGAVVTGLFVPGFQYTGKLFDARRQDRFETLTARIQAMRDSHRDLVGTSIAPKLTNSQGPSCLH
ncbi:MAG TPA: hypothetical protein VHC69_31820 [Polyangiaceae bacterium]|nr:hypothetical protein [Polyangiaceae bacterium]